MFFRIGSDIVNIRCRCRSDDLPQGIKQHMHHTSYALVQEQLLGEELHQITAYILCILLTLDVTRVTIYSRRKISHGVTPADTEFQRLHAVLQDVFDWKNYHLYDFAVYDDSGVSVTRPDHPEHAEAKQSAESWTPDL